MQLSFTSQTPLFLQIAQQLEDAIFTGLYKEGGQIPSTTEISTSERINPSTVLKGMNMLVEKGWIEKRRGLGMFVCDGAKESIRRERQKDFSKSFIRPMLAEARKLGIDGDEIVALVREECAHDEA